jgi:putative molybdopterin biosynthesis protein
VAERLAQRQPPLRLTSISSGSAEGLAALGRGEGHMAGTHLLDPASEEYNVPYVRQWLPNLPLVLVNLTYRQVGLMVAPGNPRGLAAVKDLARDDITFVNRQAGSGTRVLLDFLLQQQGVPAAAVPGYEREVYTHTMVAEAVRQGSADAGLGILAAARVFGLDFVPVSEERYDLCIPRAALDQPKVAALLGVLGDPAFRQAIAALGGYSVRQTGEIMYEQ